MGLKGDSNSNTNLNEKSQDPKGWDDNDATNAEIDSNNG